MRLPELRVTGARAAVGILGAVLLFHCLAIAQTASPWARPAGELAGRIAEILGPASAHVTVRNLSTLPDDQVAIISRLLDDDLKASGVSISSGDSANSIRITLSESTAGGLWVAEVAEGNETHVVMLPVAIAPADAPAAREKITLHRQVVARASELRPDQGSAGSVQPILAAAEIGSELAVLTPERVAIFASTPAGWTEREHADFPASHAFSRDPRGTLFVTQDGSAIHAFAPGVACSESLSSAAAASQSAGAGMHCESGDDPWPLTPGGSGPSIRAFYNPGRDYFTGVIVPGIGVDLPPFYTSAVLQGRSSGAALLVAGIDGKVILAENGQLLPAGGTRDWGSDFAVLNSPCGGGAEVLASSSGEALNDSLRAYEIPAQEAVAVSDPLSLGGSAMAVSPAADGKSVLAIVRTTADEGRRFDYEVDRVTATCN